MHSPTLALRAALCSTLLLLVSLFAAAPARAATTGEQKTAVILVNFQDFPSQPISVADAHALVFGTTSDYYWEASYQKTFLSGDTLGWFTIPVNESLCNNALFAQEADKMAIASGADLSKYQRVVYLMPYRTCMGGGSNTGSVLPTRMWVTSNAFDAQSIIHEMGHTFGLLHSGSLDCGATVTGSSCTSNSYGDPADTMGSGSARHFNATHKEKLGWLNASGQPSIITVGASGSYTIAPFETTGAGAKALKIARGVDPVSGNMSYYYIEYRQPVGFDAGLGTVGNLAQGVQVRTGGVDQVSSLLDMTPDSAPTSTYTDMRDAALAVGRSYTDSAAGVTITLRSADANGATIDVQMGGAPTPTCTRAAPTLSLSGPTASVAAGTTITYTVTLTNKDSSACAATTFNLARSIPSGWSGSLGTNTLTLSAGVSASTTLSVTSASTAAAAGYSIGAGSSSAQGSVHTANASITYTVAATGGGTLSSTVGTNKTTYVRAESVAMSVLVKNNGVPVSGASVKFNITLPNGSVTVLTATSGSDGYARSTYKTGKSKAAIGQYTLRAVATSGSSTATASTGFSVL